MPTKTKKKTTKTVATKKKTVEQPALIELPKKVDVNQKIIGSVSLKHLIWTVVVCTVIYFAVETIFPRVIPCNEGVPADACRCIRHAVSKNISFFEKTRMLIVGASREELLSHAEVSDLLRCALVYGRD